MLKITTKADKTWLAETTSALQDYFGHTDWHMFKKARMDSDYTMLKEPTASVTKCINDVTVSKTNTTCSRSQRLLQWFVQMARYSAFKLVTKRP